MPYLWVGPALHEYTTLYAFTFTSLGDKNTWTEQLSRKWPILILVVVVVRVWTLDWVPSLKFSLY